MPCAGSSCWVIADEDYASSERCYANTPEWSLHGANLRNEGNFTITRAWSNEFFDGMQHTTLSNYLRCPRLACLATECGEPEDSFVRRNVGSAIHLAREFYDGAFYTTAE